MQHLNTPLYSGDDFMAFLPTRRICGVSEAAAQDFCSIADLFYTFGPGEVPHANSNLLQAARLFQVDFSAHLHLSAYQMAFSIENAILHQAALGQQHTLYVLRKQGSMQSGWMCLVPDARLAGVDRIAQQYHLTLQD